MESNHASSDPFDEWWEDEHPSTSEDECLYEDMDSELD